MSFLRAYLRQKATLWVKTGVDGYSQPIFASPVRVSCRWEDKNEQVVNNEGNTVLSRSRVFLDRDVSVGDFLYLGISSSADPKSVVGAWRILEFRKTPNLVANDFERKAYL